MANMLNNAFTFTRIATTTSYVTTEFGLKIYSIYCDNTASKAMLGVHSISTGGITFENYRTKKPGAGVNSYIRYFKLR